MYRQLGLWILVGILGCAFIGFGTNTASAQTSPEIRAYWVDSFHAGFKSAAEVDSMLAAVRASNMNTVVVQMRQRGDTFYPSTLEPWAPSANQSFDALAYLIQQAHNGSPRIKVHCWFCMLPIWNSQTAPTMPDHVYNTHPEWLTQTSSGTTWDGSNYCIDPGVPAAAKFTCDVVMDVVNRYDVDGVHYDYIRYTGNTWGYNPTAVARFNTLYNRTGTPSSTDSSWLQFRRDQVTSIVRRLYADILAVKPLVQMTASTVTWGDGPTTDSGWTSTSAYTSVLQDWRAWMQEGILDVNMPMVYYNNATYPTYYDHWVAYAKSHKYNRQLSIGMGSYLNSQTNVYHQLADTRTGASWGGYTYYADGQQLYSYAVPYLNGTGMAASFATNLRANGYANAVSTPAQSWKTSPTKGHIRGTVLDCPGNVIDGATVSITGPESRSTKTDGNGYFAFIDLTPGTYTVTASATGQPTNNQSIGVTAGAVLNADFRLCSSAPVISNVASGNITQTGATITWTTDVAATSQVEYGTTTSYGSTTALDSTLVTSHSVNLTGLTASTTYHYRVRSKNSAGAESVSGDYTFTTSGQSQTEIIIDNLQATFTSTSSYPWYSGTYAGGWPTDNSEYNWVYNSRTTTYATCKWTPNITTAGTYSVYCWYNTGTNRTTAARYTIYYSGGSTTKTVNQQINGSQWYLLASGLRFNVGTAGYVSLANRTGETSGTKVVIADAVRFLYTGP